MTRPLRRWHLPALALLFCASRAWMARIGVYDPKLTEEREHGSAERLSDVVPVALLDSTPPEASGALGCDGVAVRATEEGGN